MFRGMFVKLGITGKESSAFGGFAFPFGEIKKGWGGESPMAQSKGCVMSVMVGINKKVESRRKGTSAVAVQKKGEVFTIIHSSTFHEDLYGTSKIDKQHTCTCITAIKQYYRFDQSVSNLISIF